METRNIKLRIALSHYTRALADGSADAYTHLDMGLSWHWHENYCEALQCFDRAVSTEPFIPYALCARASLLATCPLPELRDGEKALADALQANRFADFAGELTEEWRLRNYTAVLAAAHTECGSMNSLGPVPGPPQDWINWPSAVNR